MFKINEIYTSKQLIKEFGGNIRASMPFVKGKVPYCKFNPKINPEFPDKAWIEVGPRRRKGAEYLIDCHLRIPVFEKVKTNHWKFLGEAFITDITRLNEVRKINSNPPRDKIQLIIKFTYK